MRRGSRWTCSCCKVFQVVTLRSLLKHIRLVHSNQPNFLVECPVSSCPASFIRHHSLYKHVVSYHKCEYELQSIVDDANGQVSDDDYHGEDIDIHTHDNDQNEHDDENGDDENITDLSSEEEDELQLHAQYAQGPQAVGDEDNVIKHNAASYILKVKERNKLSQVSMDKIIDNTRSLVDQACSVLKRQLESRFEDNPNMDSSGEILNEIFDQRQDIFCGLETHALQSSYIKSHFNFVDFEEIVLGKVLKRKKSGAKHILTEVDETFVYIPILKSIEQLLSNRRIADLVFKKTDYAGENVFYDICDGSLYQNDNFFKEHPDALYLIIYHDELELCNPLGSRAVKHKVDMYYYSIGNLDPKFRSKHCSIRLLVICNAQLVKKYGTKKILDPLIEDMKLLKDGVLLNISGNNRLVFGKVIAATADNEGQHSWGGFKGGFGVAFQKCRHCHCEFEDMQSLFEEDDFLLRTKSNYEDECDEIENALNPRVKENLKTTYGINNRSALCDLPDFDVTLQLPQDIMHTFLEGTVQYEVRYILKHFIQSGALQLQELNDAINTHNFGYNEIADKFIPLSEKLFGNAEGYKLKLKSAQAKLLLRIIPFLLTPFVDPTDPYYLLLTELITITQYVFSPVIRSESIEHLSQLISKHLRNFKTLFPHVNITPKQHYTIHVPNMMKKVGPMVRYSCFGFEAAHNYYKSTAKNQNFKNIAQSLATRSQLNEACNFGDGSEPSSSHPLFATEKKFGVLKLSNDEELQYLDSKFKEFGLLPGIQLLVVYKVSWVVINGTKYCRGGVIIHGVDEENIMPLFGSIKDIWFVSDYVYFEFLEFITIGFNETYQSFHVEETRNINICGSTELVDYNILHVKKSYDGFTLIPVKYFITDILKQHMIGCNPLF